MVEILFFVFGIFVGSFLNVVVDRSARNESFLKGRSYCEKCRKNLAWHDLIPLLSFMYLQGKCRYCKTPLGYWYPVIELTTGVCFLVTFLFVNNQSSMYSFGMNSGQVQVLSIKYVFELLFYLYIVASLIVIFYTDLKFGIIPDKIILPGSLLTFLYLILNTQYLILSHISSALGACLFFFLLFIGTKGKGMGFGDVKYAFFMGLLLGFPNIITGLYIAFLTGAIISSLLVMIGKKKLKGGTVPFGPFLVFGTIISLFWGEEILRIVLKLI